MEPDNNNIPEALKTEVTKEEVVSVSEKPSTETPVANMTPKDDIVFNNKPKKNTGMILGIVLLLILAIGGVLFGVWEMIEGNTQKEQLNMQINNLKKQNSELQAKIDNSSSDVENNDGANLVLEQQNPIIMSSNSDSYNIIHYVPVWDNSNSHESRINFYIKNGMFQNCQVSTNSSGCNVNGLPGDVYKMATIGEGNGMGSEKIGFLMKDGSVYYAQIHSGANESLTINTDFTVKKAKINGFVKDIIENVGYYNQAANDISGYGTTIFVMSDNSFVKYDKSMFE